MKHTLKRKLSKIHGWLRRNNTLMDQLKDLSRQLQEAWDVSAGYKEGYNERGKSCDYLEDQLHRVARERDQERKKRLAAEDALLDMYLDKREDDELAQAAEELRENYEVDCWLSELDNEEER